MLERYGHLVEVKRVRDLRTDDPDSFRWAMSDLVAWCAETLSGWSKLARRLEEDNSYNPPSLDFKPLKGGDYKGSTRECDAWADADAKRLFGHYEDGVYVVDRLDKGLH